MRSAGGRSCVLRRCRNPFSGMLVSSVYGNLAFIPNVFAKLEAMAKQYETVLLMVILQCFTSWRDDRRRRKYQGTQKGDSEGMPESIFLSAIVVPLHFSVRCKYRK